MSSINTAQYFNFIIVRDVLVLKLPKFTCSNSADKASYCDDSFLKYKEINLLMSCARAQRQT